VKVWGQDSKGGEKEGLKKAGELQGGGSKCYIKNKGKIRRGGENEAGKKAMGRLEKSEKEWVYSIVNLVVEEIWGWEKGQGGRGKKRNVRRRRKGRKIETRNREKRGRNVVTSYGWKGIGGLAKESPELRQKKTRKSEDRGRRGLRAARKERERETRRKCLWNVGQAWSLGDQSLN